MDKTKLRQFGLLVFIGLLVWGPIVAKLTVWLLPDADLLQVYLVNKGLFAVVLLAVMFKVGGLKYFGIVRGANWWFLVPALPFLLLTAGLIFSPDATFGLSLWAAIGWVLVATSVGIGEESVFRGILWRAIESRGVLITSLTTSLLFGATHLVGLFTELPWQIICSQAVFAFGVGMMFSAVRLVSGTLLVPIVLHAVFDAGVLLAAGGLTEMFEDTVTVERLLIPGAIFAAWGLACILIVERRRRENGDNPKHDDPTKTN